MAAEELLTLLGSNRDGGVPCIVEGEATLTRGEVWGRANALADDLRVAVGRDYRLGIVDAGDSSTLIAILAAFIAERSAVLLPIDSVDELQLHRLAVEARCKVMVRNGIIAAAHQHLPPDPERLSHPDAGADPGSGSSPEALVMYTSGTTRLPRGVRLSSKNVTYNLTAMLRTAVPWGKFDRVGQVLPVTHSFGLSMALLALSRRAPLVMLGNMKPSPALAHAVDDADISVFACVPYYLRLAARRGLSLGGQCGQALRYLYLAGGGISDEDLDSVLPDFHGVTYLMYGFTEATARVAVRRLGDGAASGSVGLPLPGTYVDIVSKQGVVNPPGVEGLIRASSPSLAIGYLGERPRDPGTPFVTTDLGKIDDFGNLHVTGREVEFMNYHGNRVSAVSVEDAVMQIDGVLDARLVPDSSKEDSKCVVLVVAGADADGETIRTEIISTVRPRGIVRDIRFVDELERTRSGKRIRRYGEQRPCESRDELVTSNPMAS